jgi:2Fe-2S ferredoxin
VHWKDSGKETRPELGKSLLATALAHDIELDHACGGVCACSTCHVKVLEGADALSPSTDDEEDQLDDARDVAPTAGSDARRRSCGAPAGGGS